MHKYNCFCFLGCPKHAILGYSTKKAQ